MVATAQFLAWEYRRQIPIKNLREIVGTGGHSIDSLDCVVRVERHLDLESESPRVPLDAEGRYLERDDLRVAYETHRLEVVPNRDENTGYYLTNPLLIAALHVEYPRGRHYLGPDGRIRQDPIDLTLKPEDQALVNFYSHSQTATAVEVLISLTRTTPRVWIVHEGLPQRTYEIPDLGGFIGGAKAEELRVGYNKADPHSTRYAFPGQRLQTYSQTKGFGECEDEVLARLLALERAA